MKKQKSILSFFQKPSQKPNGDNDENTSTDDLEFVKSDPVEEIRGTDTPAEKPPRSLLFPGRSRPSSPNCSGIGSRYYGSASLLPFSSVMHKFVKDPKHNGGNRDQDRGDSSACDLLSSRENGTSSYDRPKSHISRSSNSIYLVNPKILDFDHDSKDDLCGPETPSMQPLVPGLKRIQEDCRDVRDKHGFLLSESSKRMRLLRESSTVDHGQESPTKETSKFEWLNPSSIRDANRRRPGDPFYDKRTLYIPPDVLSKMSATQRQYWDVKRQYMDLVLFFKVGKFYELYELDAEIGQKELDWKMTHSGVGKCRQVGISEAGIDVAIERLTALGYKVGRMEQVETSDQAKARGANSVIQRKLVLVSTPATSMDGKLGAEAVHLLSLKEDSWRSGNCSTVYGFAFVDFAALKFWAGSICDDASSTNLGALLVQVSPKEVIYENGGLSKETLKAIKKYAPAGSGSIQLTPIPSLEFLDALEVKNFVHTKGYFKASSNFWSSAMESQENPNLSTCALGALISYLSRLKLEDALCSGDLLPYQVYKTCLKMNGQTLVNLEIFSNNVDGGSSGTLYRYLDRCTTPSGKRLLRRWISHPLTNIEEINDRLNVVEGLVKHQGISYIIPDYLRKLPDLERLLGRVKSHLAPSASYLLPTVGVKILKQQVKAFGSLIKGLRVVMDLLRLVVKNDHESVPFSKVLNLPVLSDLDEILHQFEAAVQKDFPRYQDPDVKESDAEILSQLVEHFIVKVNEWSLIIHAISCIDVLNSFAMVSSLYGGSMCRPAILRGDSHSVDLCEGYRGGILKIKGLWHPYAVTEIDRTLVPNDVQLGEHSSESHPRALLLTGPNMGGKSTLLRATCLAVILAQLGCYVPCDSCILSPVDVIFTRLGAMDRIMSGESTFFIECAETASILQHATQDSLVLLDELGRGTSTFDGYAIAYAVFRHLVEKVQCRLLFATHYHPLTKEFSSHPHVSLQHMACAFRSRTSGSSDREEKDVVFLYRLMPGACPESYGLQVALMAGLPTEVVEAASQASGRLKSMVSENFKSSEGRSMFSTLHEDLLRSLLDVSMVEETGELDDDGFDTLLCLWHEVKSLYGGQMHKA